MYDSQQLDESLMSFVNILGISIFVLIAVFHYLRSAATVVKQ